MAHVVYDDFNEMTDACYAEINDNYDVSNLVMRYMLPAPLAAAIILIFNTNENDQKNYVNGLGTAYKYIKLYNECDYGHHFDLYPVTYSGLNNNDLTDICVKHGLSFTLTSVVDDICLGDVEEAESILFIYALEQGWDGK